VVLLPPVLTVLLPALLMLLPVLLLPVLLLVLPPVLLPVLPGRHACILVRQKSVDKPVADVTYSLCTRVCCHCCSRDNFYYCGLPVPATGRSLYHQQPGTACSC